MSSAPDPRSRRHLVITVIAQSLLAVVVLLGLYYLVPSSLSIAGRWACAILFILVSLVELRGIVKSAHVLRAVDQVGVALLHGHGLLDGRVRRHHPGYGYGEAHRLPADGLRPPGDRDPREAHHRSGKASGPSDEDSKRRAEPDGSRVRYLRWSASVV